MTLRRTSTHDAEPARHPLPMSGGSWSPLTEADASRIRTAFAATHAETTRACYAGAWQRWLRWCQGRGVVPFPASPAAACAYLAERAEDGVSLASIDLACCAIGDEHRRRCQPDLIANGAVRRVRRGLRRIVGTAPRRSARPLSVGDVRQIIAGIDRSTRQGARDAAVILLGFAGALRRSELAALTLADLEVKPAGIVVHVRRSKTDPNERGQVVGVVHGQHPLTDPIAAVDAWLTVRGHAPGPVFTSMRPGRFAMRPISGDSVSRIVKERAASCGLGGAARITAHSLRAGHATSAAMAGVGVDRIAAQTRHRRIDILMERYVRPAQ